jgi:quinol monooxygenase YgiN
MTEHERDEAAGPPMVALIEWPTTGLDLAAAQRLAVESERNFRRAPGLVDIRFFGDFERGVHYYLLTWRDRAALDAYLGSEAMFANRALAGPYLAGKVSRTIFVDYTPRAG